MAYTKNYYSILSVQPPIWGTPSAAPSPAALRKAYKLALLSAHPDKQQSASPSTTTDTPRTVDDVKEAYAVLSDARSRAHYDEYLLRQPGLLRADGGGGGGGVAQALSSDFVLGLEMLDLSDFEAGEVGAETGVEGCVDADADADAEAQMEWTRGCRCGAEKGFRIVEQELEDAETRGEKEVLVGCEGCSLWVRVAFDVEEG